MKIILIIALLAILATSDSPAQTAQASSTIASMEGPVLAEEAKADEQRSELIPQYVDDELKEYSLNSNTFFESESFIITLAPSQQFQFRYKIQSNPNPTMGVKIFTQENEDDIAPLREHEEDNYLEVQTCTTLYGNFTSAGKAYLAKILHLGYHNGPELFVRLQSKYQAKVIIEVSLTGPPANIDRFNIIKNQQFSITANKLGAIQQEMREFASSNLHQFKFQWGFLEREEHYEQEMLKLTAFEALVILGTAIVQMYCIKNLFDKNGVI